MSNSDYVPSDFQLMVLDITYLLLGILQLMLSMCVVATMWQPSQIVMPLRHVCIFHAVLFIILGFFHIHNAFSSLISHHQTGFICHFRFISIIFFKVMVLWNVLVMIWCSILLVHPGRPFIYIFVSTKYFLMLVLVNAVFSGAIVFLVFSTGTAQMKTNCTINIIYSAEASGYIQGLAFLLIALLCFVRLWRHFRRSCPVSPGCSGNEPKNKRFSTASNTLLTYSIFFLFFAILWNVVSLHTIMHNHVTFFWYYFKEMADISWQLSGIILFPICFARHTEIQMNFYSMICFKCMMFDNVFHQEVDDTYKRVSLLREVLHDPKRRDALKARLLSVGNNRLSNTYVSNPITQRASKMSLSAPDQRPIPDSFAQLETLPEVNDVSQRSVRQVSSDP